MDERFITCTLRLEWCAIASANKFQSCSMLYGKEARVLAAKLYVQMEVICKFLYDKADINKHTMAQQTTLKVSIRK